VFKHEFYIQSPATPGSIQRGLLTTASAADFNRVLVAVAYVTEGGVRILDSLLREHLPQWESLYKEWLLSLDDGFTDPKALRLLTGLSNSTVRLHQGNETLDASLRRASTRFHHKVFLFDGGPNSHEIGLFSGSANLTLSGLYSNDEQAVSTVWHRPFRKTEQEHHEQIKRQRKLLEDKIADGTLLTDAILRRYENLRTPIPQEDDDVVRQIAKLDRILPLPQAAAMATARAFWVEVRNETRNLGSARPGSQIDLTRGSRIFFGFGAEKVEPNHQFGEVTIKIGDESIRRTLRYGHNGMDKINLPIPGQSGPATYRNKTLLFEKTPDGSYKLTVDAGRRAADWKIRSEERGTSYEMQRSGRQYGVF